MKSKKFSKSVIPVLSVILLLASLLFAVKSLSDMITVYYEDEKIVCLDAGHGGDELGATYKERLEKDDNLTLTLKIKEKLNEKGIKTVLTRSEDITVELKDRCKIANNKSCDLFISVHRNSSSTDGSGFEAWISQNEKNGEKLLAEKLVQSLYQISKTENRGVKSGYRNSAANNYYVNANTNMPSVLLEVGFITNENDNSEFDSHIDEYAQAVADMITEYLSE